VTRVATFLSSSIGRKVLMALTGLAMIGFLVAHLIGNLLIFSGPDMFNGYSAKLISNPLIYVAEALLVVFFVSHFTAGLVVTWSNWGARPVAYQVKRRAGYTSHKSWASTTMIFSGLVLLVFVPLHLWQFKFGPEYEVAGQPHVRDLYRLVIEFFHRPSAVVLYIVVLAIIGFHLWHAFESALESLGMNYRPFIRRVGQFLAAVLTVGFILVPVLIFTMGGRP